MELVEIKALGKEKSESNLNKLLDLFHTEDNKREIDSSIGRHYQTNPIKVAQFILDPFTGSGTVRGVAHKMNRKVILCKLYANFLG